MDKVFISGSISIKQLPEAVLHSLQRILENNYWVLIGDAPGVDTLVQNYFAGKNYQNVIIYFVGDKPRHFGSPEFELEQIMVKEPTKQERKKQQEKDQAMAVDCDFGLVVWDGMSSGSCANIQNILKDNKRTKVYLTLKNTFLPSSKVTPNNIEFIYRENAGYSAEEFIFVLKQQGVSSVSKISQLYTFLLNQGLLEKVGKVYSPKAGFSQMFHIRKFRGRPSGVKFGNELVSWFEQQETKGNGEVEQGDLFST